MDIYKEATRQQKGIIPNGTINADVSKYKARNGTVIPNRVFVGGISPTASEDDLLPLFGKYGQVRGIKIVNDENGQSKGYGFVTYERADDCQKLQNDSKNLIFNDRRLNVAPAVMKHAQPTRFTEYVVPVTPNLYFTNSVPYQYQDGAAVYPSSPYVPPLTVVPTVSDAAYYQNNYNVPAAPYQGAALFYPVPNNPSPVMVGHQSYSQYQSAGTTNSIYVNSSPNPNSSSPPNSVAAKNSNAMTCNGNSTELHLSHNTPLISATPPNMSTLPPPLPYQIAAHQPHFYNSSIIPQYTGEVYYNMVHNACYPMMAVSSQEAYSIPYYEVNESCAANLTAEDNNSESANSYHSNAATMMSSTPELNGCDSSPVSINSNGGGNNECKSLPPLGPPPPAPPPPSQHQQQQQPPPSSGEHIREYASDANGSPPSTVISTTTPSPTGAGPTLATVQQTPQHTPTPEYSSSMYAQHRNGGALIYPSTPLQQPNVYFNSMYSMEANNPPYSKNLSEHFVSDHLPKRDTGKYPPKKFIPPQSREPKMPPPFPYGPNGINNNFVGFANRNVKDKDYKNMGGGKNGDMKMTPQHQQQRLVRNNFANGNNPTPKPRVFHNQNQYGGPPRMKGDRMMSQNGHHHLRNGYGLSRQASYDMNSAPSNPYSYPAYPHYPKNTGYEGHRRIGQPNNNNYGGYRPKHDRQNGSNESYYANKNAANDERMNKKNVSQQENANSSTNNDQSSELNNTTPSTETKEPQQQQQQQLCAEMQNLAV